MYCEFFGLKEVPFNITPDPDFMFFSTRHHEAFVNLLYGIKNRKGFMEVTGDIGTGKTTLYRTLLTHMGNEISSALITNPALSAAQLVQTIIEDFEIQVEKKNRKGYSDALNRFLLELEARGSTAVLILDEAQNLKPGTLEQIRLLSNFETNKTKLLQIILVGQPELRTLLEKPSLEQLRQRITVSAHLSPLDRNETEQYVAHRIKIAGGHDMLIFDPAALDEIHTCSQGIPRLINVLCDKALMMAYFHRTGLQMGTLISLPKIATPLAVRTGS